MRRSTKWMLLGASTGAAAALASAYGLIGRPWHLRWGATADEVSRAMPFDDLIARPNYFATRAVTIDAKPEEVWPFLIDTTLLPKGTLIRRVEEKRIAVFAPPEVEAEATWVVMLEPRDGKTRVVSRTRARFGHSKTAVLRYLVVDPGQFFIERRWLLTVKERAEDLAHAVRVSEPAVEKAPEPVAT